MELFLLNLFFLDKKIFFKEFNKFHLKDIDEMNLNNQGPKTIDQYFFEKFFIVIII